MAKFLDTTTCTKKTYRKSLKFVEESLEQLVNLYSEDTKIKITIEVL